MPHATFNLILFMLALGWGIDHSVKTYSKNKVSLIMYTFKTTIMMYLNYFHAHKSNITGCFSFLKINTIKTSRSIL